jgi:hypothetical protein
MPEPRDRPDDAPNIGSTTLEDDVQQLLGAEPRADQDAVVDEADIEDPDEPTLSEQEWGTRPMPDRAMLLEATDTQAGDVVSLDDLTDAELRAGETTDPLVAIEEGEVWIAPSDPPVVPSDDPEGIEIAAGPGVSADDEPYDDSHRSGELDAEGSLNARVREALRADAATSPLADRLEIAVVGSTAIIRGTVDGIEDSDAIIDVASRVSGIDDVRDETEIPGL